jgi:hypothetical protein
MTELEELASISTPEPDATHTLKVQWDNGFVGWCRPEDLLPDDSAPEPE